jgi:hypothetical protein
MNLFAMTSDPYSDTYTTSPEATAMSMGILLFMFAIGVVIYIISAWLLGKIFKKAGVESWKAWVPVYSTFVLLELGGYSGWWALALLVPFVNIVAAVFTIMAVHQINLKFGKDIGFTVLYFFIPLAWSAVLAFDGSRWEPRRVATR